MLNPVGFTPLTVPPTELKGIYFNDHQKPYLLPESEASRTDKIAILTFDDYVEEMNRLKLPLILVVGCGHSGHNHLHPNSWCVNLDVDKNYHVPKESSEEFKERMQHDAVLDITSIISYPSRPSDKPHSIRDNPSETTAFAQTILEYKNKFDVVLLERPYPKTLNKAWTLWNAVHMLKVGGELIIDSCEGYDSELYTTKNECELTDDKIISKIKRFDFYVAACCTNTLESGNYKESVKSENYLEKIKRFKIPEKSSRKNWDMVPMANYLTRWFLSDIINEENAYQPYAERNTRLISATKTQSTEDAMEEWAQAIKSFNFMVCNQK